MIFGYMGNDMIIKKGKKEMNLDKKRKENNLF